MLEVLVNLKDILVGIIFSMNKYIAGGYVAFLLLVLVCAKDGASKIWNVLKTVVIFGGLMYVLVNVILGYLG